MDDWPLVIAGPIVRRVEPLRVSVWVALKAARRVRLSIFDAPVDTGPGDTVFGDASPTMLGHASTVRVGENLHIAVVQAQSLDALLPGHIYAYNVAFGDPNSELFSPLEDLRSLQLLRDHPPDTGNVTFALPHLALGYEAGLLPTFVMAPAELTKLRIVHGSCRRPAAEVPDLMAHLDTLIEAARIDATQRPHQLFLTGDQIYADDVAPALQHLCTRVGNQLLGTTELLPVQWTPPGSTAAPQPLPADHRHFPAACRKAVVRVDARLSTNDGESHLLSLGEFCAMHLLVWSNALWGKELPTYDELFWGAPLPSPTFDAVLAGTALPPPIWQLHLGLYADSEFGLKETFEETRKLNVFSTQHCADVLKRIRDFEDGKRGFAAQTASADGGVLKAFRSLLPKVRRALANVSTYMMFDDHEVTDDWNLSQIWRDRVFNSPLGTTVLRNGLLAYMLCQGWGNDPDAFERDVPQESGVPEPSPAKQLLLGVPQLFAAGAAASPNREAADVIDRLLGLDGADPPVKWHYTVDGPRHRVLALDNRTRRAFSSRTATPTNLSPSALREQIPNRAESALPAGIEVLFVIAPLPLLGLPVFDELAGPIAFRAYDVLHHRTSAGLPGTNPDAAEAWSNVPAALEQVLQRLAAYQKVVVLSGDVHHAHSCEASYWKRGDASPARFAQFTSSGFKNVWPLGAIVADRSLAFAQRLFQVLSPSTRLGWFDADPPAVRMQTNTLAAPGLRDALLRSPVLLPAEAWPSGTQLLRDPDWAWSVAVCVDTRARAALPEGGRPAPLDPENPEADVALDLAGYRQAARRHALQLDKSTHTRRLLFASNLGLVTFQQGAGEALSVHHDLFAAPSGAPAIYTNHKVVLDLGPAPMPTLQVKDEPPGAET